MRIALVNPPVPAGRFTNHDLMGGMGIDDDFGVVLGPFHRLQERTWPARNDPEDLLRLCRERRRTLDGIEHSEPPRGASATVEQAPPLAHVLGNAVDRRGDARQFRMDRGSHRMVLEVHRLYEGERRHRVKLRRVGVAGLG